MLPDFLLVGFAKCGTTSIQKILERHPDIYLPKEKETQFMYLDFEYKKGIGYYEKRFYNIPSKEYKCVGGIEPSWAGEAKKVKKHFPKDVKLIFIMRNPVDFTYSLYRMEAYLGIIPIDNVYPFQLNQCFEYELKKERQKRRFDLWEHNFNGFYIRSIKEYLKYFPIENMLFVFFEDFKRDERAVSNQICRFLGVDDFKYIPQKITHVNENSRFPANYVYSILNMYCRKIVFCLKEKNLCDLEYSKIVDRLRRQITVEDFSQMSVGSRKRLEKLYSKSVRELETITGRNLKEIWF